MTLIPPRSLTSAPAVSPSLVPSDVPDAGLPFGKAPPRLVELETMAGGIQRELRRRVRALAENANQVRHRSPLTAAVCWNEAGRLLDRRAGRTAEAWICHSRALALFPDHKPALAALRRLARRAQDVETLRSVLVAEVERATNPVEQSSMYTEIAVIDIKAGRLSGAMESLREASRIWPDGLMADLLKLGAATSEEFGQDLVETMTTLALRWPEPHTIHDMKMILALVEERLGRLDLAHKNLHEKADGVPISLAALWAKSRLCLRLDRPEEALSSIDSMIARIETPSMRRSLERFRQAIRVLGCEPQKLQEENSLDSQSLVWDLELLDATRLGDRERVAQAAKNLQTIVQTPGFKEALVATEASCQWSPSGPTPHFAKDFDQTSVVGRALMSFFGLETEAKSQTDTEDAEHHDTDGASFHVKNVVKAILYEDWENILGFLSRVRKQTTEENDRWAIAVAIAAIQIQQQGRSKEAIDLLISEGQQSDRRPLPVLIRRYTNDETILAELAIAEAEDSVDDEFKANRLIWAAGHFEESDKERAEQLYLQALEIVPSARFAIAGLERLGAGHLALASAYLSAAESVDDRPDRARYQIRAGLEYMLDKQGNQATALLCAANKSLPEDKILARTVLRFALSHPQDIEPEFVETSPENESTSGLELIAFGSLGLAINPAAAVHWFKKAAHEFPADPIVAVGLEMALLRSGRATDVSSELLNKAGEAQTPEEEAWAYQRIAEIDRGYQDDPSAAVLSLLSLEEELPGHHSSLLRLIVHYLENDQLQELPHLLVALSRSLTDVNTRGALASAAWAVDPFDAALLKEIIGFGTPSILDLTEYEGLTGDASEKIELLEKINDRLESSIHMSRLAESIGDMGDHVKAAEKYQEVLNKRPDGIFEMFETARHQRDMGDHRALKDTLVRLGDVSIVLDHRVEALLEAARLARDELDDPTSAVELCLDVLANNPQNQEAYGMGRELLENSDNKRQHADLLVARLSTVQDEQIRREIHLELAGVLVELGEPDDRDSAKQYLVKALEVVAEDIDTERWLARIYQKDREWTEAIEHLTAAAHLVRDETEGCEVFLELGEIYMDHTEYDDLAEKSFLKVLGWDNTNFAAMERMADLYIRMENYGRALKAMEHLVRLAPDTNYKIEKMVGLANLMSQKFGAHEKAEKLLGDARRVDPYAFEPVEALTKIYQEQNDNLALNIHLDQALASQAGALRNSPDNIELYSHIIKLANLKHDYLLGSLAEEASAIVKGEFSEQKNYQRWRIGARLGDPQYDGYLCPKTVAAGLRETMRIVEEPLANLHGVSAKQLDMGRAARLDRRSQMAEIVNELVNGFGFKEVTAFVDNKTSVRVAPGNPPAIIFPQSVVSSPDEAVHRFAVVSGLQMLRFGLSLATVLPLDKLRMIYAGVVRLSIPDYAPEGLDAREIGRESERIRGVLNSRIFERIHSFAFDCTDAVNREDTGQQILGVGYRAGLMGAGSLSGAVKGLRIASGKPEGILGELPGAGQMMAFVFSPDHVEMRKRLGI